MNQATMSVPVETHDEPQGRLQEMINDAMEKNGVSIKDLSDKLDVTYEHIRRIVRGTHIPATSMLKLLCQELGVSYKEANRLATADRLIKKYGTIPLELAGKKPSLEPIERVWDTLTTQQQADATSMITGWAKRNRQAARDSK